MPKRSNAFQRMVYHLKRALYPSEAKVVESAMIPAQDTATLTEVDVVIEFEQGTQAIRIGVECQDHGRPGSPSWIRSLKTKRDTCGLDIMIAMHAKGFTKPAIEAARKYNIRTLELRNMSDEQMKNEIQRVVTIQPSVHIEILTTEIGLRVKSASEIEGVCFSFLYGSDKETMVSIRQVVLDFIAKQPPPIDDIAPGSNKEIIGTFRIKPGTYYSRDGERIFDVLMIRPRVRITKSKAPSTLGPRIMRSAGGDIVDATIQTWSVATPEGSITFCHTTNTGTGDQTFYLELPEGTESIEGQGSGLHVEGVRPSGEHFHETIAAKKFYQNADGSMEPVPLVDVFSARISCAEGCPSWDSVVGFYYPGPDNPIELGEFLIAEFRRQGLDTLGDGENTRTVRQTFTCSDAPKQRIWLRMRDNGELRLAKIDVIEAEFRISKATEAEGQD